MSEDFVDDIIAATTEQTQPEETVNTEDISNKENSDQVGEEVGEEEPTEKTTEESSEPSGENPIEELATKLGWKPDHDSESFVDAETYILRSREIQDSMKNHNRDLKGQLNTLQSSVEALKLHNERVYKAEVNRLQSQLNKLQSERDSAIEMADKDKVKQLDGEIDSIKKNLSEPEPQEPAPTSNPIYDEWVKDNQWYVTDKDMAVFADNVAQQYVGAPADRVYSLVRQKVAEVWPEKFKQTQPENKPQSKLAQVEETSKGKKANPVGPVSPVEGATKSGNKPTFTKADLTSDQQSIMRQFVAQGIMTEDQYIADIAKLQEA